MSPSLPACRHRGAQFAPDRWVCSSPKLVVSAGVRGNFCRSTCPYVDHALESEEANGVPPDATGGLQDESKIKTGPSTRPCAQRDDASLGAGYGVVIGTYDSRPPSGQGRYGVEAVHLNLAVLRANCGPDVCILLCDDASPPESRRRYRELCRRFQAEFVSNPVRLGHTCGDMAVYHRAVRWAHRLGLRTVTKLSHRMLFDVPHWVQQDSERLIRSGHGTMTQMLANFGGEQVRTECVMMVTARWYRPDILARYDLRQAPTWNEGHTFQVIRQLVDDDKPYPGFLPWHRLGFIRGRDRPPVYFRQMAGNAEQEFRRLAAKYNVDLGESFCTADSIGSADYQQ